MASVKARPDPVLGGTYGAPFSDAERARRYFGELLRDYPVSTTPRPCSTLAMRILRQASSRGEQGGHAGVARRW